SDHLRDWPRRAWFIVAGFAIIVGLLIVGAILAEPAAPGRSPSPHWLFGVAGLMMLVYLPAFLVVHLRATRPVGNSLAVIELAGASREFADAVTLESGKNR